MCVVDSQSVNLENFLSFIAMTLFGGWKIHGREHAKCSYKCRVHVGESSKVFEITKRNIMGFHGCCSSLWKEASVATPCTQSPPFST
jgi:hypothetical protein